MVLTVPPKSNVGERAFILGNLIPIALNSVVSVVHKSTYRTLPCFSELADAGYGVSAADAGTVYYLLGICVYHRVEDVAPQGQGCMMTYALVFAHLACWAVKGHATCAPESWIVQIKRVSDVKC